MSPAPKPTQTPPSSSWFLRKEDGVVYGPVSREHIIRWAKAGRIAPGDQVSHDRKSWAPASAFSDLDMYWIIETPDGERYGPVHLEACRNLAREGQIEKGTILCNTRTGARVEVEESQEPEAEKMSVPPAPNIPPTWSILARERDRFADESRRWKNLYENERRSSSEAAAAAAERIRSLEQEAIRLHAEREQATVEMAQLKKLLRGSKGTPGFSGSALTRIHFELSRRFEDLSLQYEKRIAEFSAQNEELDRLRKESAEREEQNQKQLRREQAMADEARRKHAELEKSYAETLRALREINDLFIRDKAGLAPHENSAAASPSRQNSPSQAGSTQSRPAGGSGPARSKRESERGPRIRLTR